jgi:hypothetical protein
LPIPARHVATRSDDAVDARSCLAHHPQSARPPRARATAAFTIAAGLTLLAAACGSSPRSQVAQLGTTTTQTSSVSPSPRSGSTQNQALAYAKCLRTQGVPNWPDPSSSGAFDKSKLTLQQLGVSISQLQAAQAACQRLLPNGGERPDQTGLRKLERDAVDFARCMRSHGVPNWPDYTVRDGTPLYDLHGTTIAPTSPLIVAKQLRCRSLLRLSDSPATSGGARSDSGSD